MDYSGIIRRSIETVKGNYWLLIYGIVLGGLGQNISNNTSFDEEISEDASQEITRIFSSGSPQAAIDTSGQILGSVTNSFANWFFSVPPYKWVLAITLIVIFLVIGFAVGIVMISWAYGALIKGIDMAQKGEKTTLLNTSPHGLSNLKPLIKLGLLNFLIIVLTFLGLIAIAAPIYLLAGSHTTGAFVFYGFLAVSFLVIVLIILSYGVIYGMRFIVFEQQGAYNAFKSGVKLFRHNIKHSFIMSLVNAVFGFIAGIILAIAASPILLVFASSQTPGVVEMFVAFWIIVLGIFVSIVVNAALSVFIQSNWNQIFLNLSKQNERN